MKITKEDSAAIVAAYVAGAAKLSPRADYMARDPSIARIALATDAAKRYRWDCLYAGGFSGSEAMARIYRYADDSHIDTVLRGVDTQ
jgi:hypothetical protein